MSTDENEIETETTTAPAAVPHQGTPVAEPREPLRGVTAEKPLCTVGRRKAAQARLRIWPGAGKVEVNGRKLDGHFSLEVDRANAMRPLALTGGLEKYDCRVTVRGGGNTGQADAIALSIARALSLLEPVHMPALRNAGLLTRDARVKERKKYGRRGARRGFQFSKR
jgi:small subunit ribosomal protein S9